MATSAAAVATTVVSAATAMVTSGSETRTMLTSSVSEYPLIFSISQYFAIIFWIPPCYSAAAATAPAEEWYNYQQGWLAYTTVQYHLLPSCAQVEHCTTLFLCCYHLQ